MSQPIKAFQKKHGLVADGILGPKSYAKMMEVFKMNRLELAHFLGQCAHESGTFTITTENLNYSADRLLVVFKKYFTKEQAKAYEKKPILIGSRVYANRMGNGSEQSLEGYKFRGRGALQTTGKSLYEALGKFIGVNLLNNPDLVSEEYFFESALYYFEKNNIRKYCKDVSINSITTVSKIINVGNAATTVKPNGLDDRITKTLYYYERIK